MDLFVPNIMAYSMIITEEQSQLLKQNFVEDEIIS